MFLEPLYSPSVVSRRMWEKAFRSDDDSSFTASGLKARADKVRKAWASAFSNSTEPFYDETSSWDVAEVARKRNLFGRNTLFGTGIGFLVWNRPSQKPLSHVCTFSLCIECARHRFEKWVYPVVILVVLHFRSVVEPVGVAHRRRQCGYVVPTGVPTRDH